jgi:hypothetical protein
VRLIQIAIELRFATRHVGNVNAHQVERLIRNLNSKFDKTQISDSENANAHKVRLWIIKLVSACDKAQTCDAARRECKCAPGRTID